jgi:hypothetical protein
MDATPNVAPARQGQGKRPLPAQSLENRSAAAVRQQIYSTLDDLHRRVAELQGYIDFRFGTIKDPLHVRERVAAQPIRACGIALVAGVVCGMLRAHRLPRVFARQALLVSGGVVRGAGATLGSTLVSDLLIRALGGQRCDS